MEKINSNKVGLALGIIFALIHFLWSLMVLFGFAQKSLYWIFRLHFINFPMATMGFNFGKMLLLVALGFIVGYIIGWLFSVLLNSFKVKQ